MKAVDLTVYDETVNDVTEIYKMVTGLEGVNGNEVYVLGHSFGAYKANGIIRYP